MYGMVYLGREGGTQGQGGLPPVRACAVIVTSWSFCDIYRVIKGSAWERHIRAYTGRVPRIVVIRVKDGVNVGG